MSGDDKRVVIECHELSLNGTDDFLIGTAPEIRSPDALAKQSIARKKNVPIGPQMKRGASWCVSGSVKDAQFDPIAGDRIAVLNEAVDRSGNRPRDSGELRLNVQVLEQRQVGLVNGCGHARLFLKIVDCPDVIDMRVGADDLFRL